MSALKKKCDLCAQSTNAEGDDLIFFGEWITKKDLTVHYFCLLLSTNLPQNGADNAGMLGFHLRDIRKEAQLAKSRECMYCAQTSATIMCQTCKQYYHLTCGFTSFALSQFRDEFPSYCDRCIPHDDQWELLKKESPGLGTYKCYICINDMGYVEPSRWIYGKCCGNRYVHSRCMKLYALKAGYYLSCIWCKDPKFREYIKDMGVFVPDRDANWERDKGAYQDLYRGHQRCDMEICNCPKGRDYINGNKWSLITCKLCGSFGAHNPACIPGMEHDKVKAKEFKCDTCSTTERTILSQSVLEESVSDETLDGINTSLYIQKNVHSLAQISHQASSVEFSDDSLSSMETVVNRKLFNNKVTKDASLFSDKSLENATRVYKAVTSFPIPSLTQSEELSENAQEKNSETVLNEKDTNDALKIGSSRKPDPKAIKMLVERMLNLFDP